MATIYKITNTITNEVYIGCTKKSVHARFREHKSRSHQDKYLTIKLYRSIRDYGIENFIAEKLFECDDNLKYEFEINTILKFDSFNNGLNHTIGGVGIIGYEYTKEHVQKRIDSYNKNGHNRKGRNYSEIYGERSIKESEKRKDSVTKFWNNISDEDRLKRSLAITKNYLEKSGFSVDDIKEIKRLRNCGMKIKEISKLFTHLSTANIKNISAPNKWNNINLLEC